MDCKRVKALMEEGTGALPGSEQNALREHLEACEGCARESGELSVMRSLLSAAPRHKAPAGFSAGFLSERIAAGQTTENYTELASLEELDTVPPGSMGDMYLSIKENGNEQ